MKTFVLVSARILFWGIAVLPVVFVVGDSLIHDGRFSLESYRGVLAEERQRKLLGNSLELAVKTALLGLMAGVPTGFFLQRGRVFAERFLRVGYLAPLILPPHVHVVAWVALCGNTGMLNRLLQTLFSLEEPFFSIYTLNGAAWVLGLTYFPIITLFTLAGLASVDPRLEEAGRFYGSSLRVFFRITLPLVWPYVLGGAILVFILAVSNYGVPSLLRVHTYPVEIMVSYGAFYDPKAAVALSFPVLVVILGLVLLYHGTVGKKPFVTVETHSRRGHRRGMNPPPESRKPAEAGSPCASYSTGASDFQGAFRNEPGDSSGGGNGIFIPANRPKSGASDFRSLSGTVFVLSLILVSTAVPVAALVMESGSLGAWATALKTAREQMATSVLASASAATLATALFFLVAYADGHSGPAKRRWRQTLAILPFALPGPVLAIGMIQIWNRPWLDGVYGSLAVVVLALMARFCPLSLKPVSANLGQIHPNLEAAARIAGGGWLRRLFRIVVPLALPGLAASWVITYLFCMGELSASLLVMPPGDATLSIRIYTLMHYGAGNLVACLCLYLILLTLVPVALVLWGYRRWHGAGRDERSA